MRKALFVFFFLPFMGILLLGASEKESKTKHTPTTGSTVRPTSSKVLLEMHSKSLLNHEKDIGELKKGMGDLQKDIEKNVSAVAEKQVAKQIQSQNKEIQSQTTQLQSSIENADKTNRKLADNIERSKSKPWEKQLEFWTFYVLKLLVGISICIIIGCLFYHHIYPEPTPPKKNGSVTNLNKKNGIFIIKKGLWNIGGIIKIEWKASSADKKTIVGK